MSLEGCEDSLTQSTATASDTPADAANDEAQRTLDSDVKLDQTKHYDSGNESSATKPRKKRKYMPCWKDKWSWLMYDPLLDVVKCQYCMQANDLKLLKSDKRGDDAFISRGFKNWDKGPDRFAKHEASVNHHESVTNLATIRCVPSVDSKLNSQIADGQKMAREALQVIFTSLRFLATQNIAIQGSTHNSGNFLELLKLRCDDRPSLKAWIAKRNNYTSDTIQNEILEMLAHDIQRQIVCDIDKSPYIGIIADGTTDEDTFVTAV